MSGRMASEGDINAIVKEVSLTESGIQLECHQLCCLNCLENRYSNNVVFSSQML